MAGVKNASISELEYHMAILHGEWDIKHRHLKKHPQDSHATAYRRRCHILRTMIQKCRREIERRTGKSYYYETFDPVPVQPAKGNEPSKRKSQQSEKKRIADLIDLGRRESQLLKGHFFAQVDNFYNQGFSNLVAANWVTFFGGTSPKVLKLSGAATFPKILKLLSEAESANLGCNFTIAHYKLNEAAKELKRMNGL